ncbi:RNA-binding protein 38 [Zostera marina]|uniref:RNA-binding protein 38 n=1 Tax=Zostera marina TaxID=29655 RepID=A0A0K9PUE7_ZOSMR|nr:RNA-binding protein 38 [Zostera marina]
MSRQGLSGQQHHQFGDTTHTKIFVGGLAWETKRETMKKYFDQFGEILEAVVITDKNTGRSKGYGFVTFRDPESARLSCIDAAPVIDGRRANCNLASLGVQRSTRSITTQQTGMCLSLAGRNLIRPPPPLPTMIKTSSPSFRIIPGLGGVSGGVEPVTTFPHYPFQQGSAVPYGVYGYSPYSPDYSCYYGIAGSQYQFYPYFQFDQASAFAAAPATYYPAYYGGPMPLQPSLVMGTATSAPAPPALGLIPAQFSPSSKQSLV